MLSFAGIKGGINEGRDKRAGTKTCQAARPLKRDPQGAYEAYTRATHRADPPHPLLSDVKGPVCGGSCLRRVLLAEGPVCGGTCLWRGLLFGGTSLWMVLFVEGHVCGGSCLCRVLLVEGPAFAEF